MKSFTKIMAALALLVFMAPSMVMWGQVTHTIGWGTASGDAGTYTNFDATSGQVSGVLSFTSEKNSSSSNPAYNANASELRLYFASSGDGGSITITPVPGVTITDAVMTTSTTPSVNYFVDGGNATSVTASNSTYTISDISASTSLKIQNANTTNTQLRIKTIALTYTTSGPAPTTYTVTYHANVTGTADIEETYYEGDDVTIADNTFTNPGYAFTEWNTEEDGSGDSYSPGDEIEDLDDNWDFYAQWEESSTVTYTYNFAGANNFYTDAALTTHPGSGNGNNVETIYYGDGSTFVASGTNRYFSSASSGYFMLGKTGAQISLPTFEGYKITQVIVHTSGSVSGNVQVSIVSGSHTVSAAQQWATNSDFTYNIAADYQASPLSLNVTNNYNSQFTSIQLVCEVDVPSSVATPTFDPADGTTFGNEGLSVTITCETPNAAIYYTIDGSTPDNNSTLYEGAITLTTTATIKAIAYDGTNYSNVATATYTYIDPNAPGTENNPYTVAQARAAIDANTGITGVYATGIVSAIPTAWNSQYSNITFNFVDNVGDTDFLQAYRCVSGTGVDASEVAVGDIVVVYGNLTKYGSTYEFGSGCQLVSLTHPAVEVEAPVFGLAEGGYADTQTVTLTCATEGSTIYYTTDGSTPDNNSTTYSDGITVSQTTTIKAIAYNNGSNSTVSAATYYILSNDNTLTVTDALGFDSYPVNNIFVQGIVSTAPTQAPTNNGELTYYISVDGAANDQLEVYKGKDLNNTAFDAQDDIQLGDIVTIFGNVKIFNNQKEFDQGNYLVAFERPEIPVIPSVTVTPATVNAPFAGTEGTLVLTYENIEEFISFDYYFCDANGGELEGNDPDWIYAEIQGENDTYSLYYIIDANDGEARTAYLKVYTFDDNMEEVYAIVTVNQEEYVAPALDYATLPFEFDGGRNDIESTDGLTQEGLDSDYGSSPKLKFNTTGDWLLLHFNERPGTLTFDIKGNGFSQGSTSTFTVQTSEDGVTYTDLENYTTLSEPQSEEFDNLGENVRYIKWIYTEKGSTNGGNVALGNIALTEYVEPVLVASITVNPDMVEVNADEHDGTLDLTYENLTITEMGDFAIQYYDAVGEETEEPDWIEVLVAEQDPAEGEGYVVSYYMMKNEGEARTAYFKVYAMDDETNLVYSNLVTVNQAAYVAPVAGSKYVKVTSTDDLTDGQYLIVYEEVGLAFDGSLETLDAVSNTIDVTIAEGEIAVTEETTASEFTIAALSEGYSIQSASGYYIGQTSNANGLASSTENAYMNTISFTDGNADIVSSSAYLRYNSASNQARFRYFKSASYTNQQAIQLYKKVETPVTETYELIINGYTDDNVKNGYYLIASPVTVDPATVEGMTTGDFDLYEYDDTQDKEWLNWKGDQELNYEGHFNLVPGMGYLYAKKATDDNLTYNFILTGSPYDGTGTFDLVEGWNLLGNPFGETAYLDDSRDFYRMNSDGSDLIVNTDPNGGGNAIRIMEGIFVNAEVNDQVVTFTTENPGNGGKKIALNVSRNRGDVIDRAIVRFDEGSLLPKFQLNPDNTKIYITEGNQDYAVVRSAYESEMPVSFKASENGTYTFSANAANVEMTYLHLIDNLTGADIDLLATPSYTFDARTTDYASRFKLVFVANNGVNEQNGNDFAFFNGSEWMITNEGEATLEVIDMTGRILNTMTVNGNATTKVNAATGVYMLRLTNGNDVKTQKVVVK